MLHCRAVTEYRDLSLLITRTKTNDSLIQLNKLTKKNLASFSLHLYPTRILILDLGHN